MILWLVRFYAIVSGNLIVEYRFSYNYGEVFHDFSENLNLGVNGDDPLGTSHNSLPTDRGAYFNAQSEIIKLPANYNCTTNITLPADFSIVM